MMMKTQAAAVLPTTPFAIAEANYRKTQAAVSALSKTDTPQKSESVTVQFLDAVTAIDATPTSSLSEFARSFMIAMDDGESVPSEEVLDRLFADAKRLTAAEEADAEKSAAFCAALDASDAASAHYNGLPDSLEDNPEQLEPEMAKLAEATVRADRAVPTNWAEFMRLLKHHCEGGEMNVDSDNAKLLLAHGQRLLSKEA